MRHVELTCKHHPHLRWSCKEIAFTPGYGYNDARNIFYNSREPECQCSARDLVYSPEELERQKTEPLE